MFFFIRSVTYANFVEFLLSYDNDVFTCLYSLPTFYIAMPHKSTKKMLGDYSNDDFTKRWACCKK